MTSHVAPGSPINMDNTVNKRRAKKRVRAFTANERASHRVIEKQRREALNESFLDLARLIPSLAQARRLSKSAIVHESIQYLRSQRAMCIAAASEIQAIVTENLDLVAEVNRWRGQCGLPGLALCQPKPVGDAVASLLRVDQDILGTFPGGFGDNSNGDDHDEDQGVEVDGRSRFMEGADPVPSSVSPAEVPTSVLDTIVNLPHDTRPTISPSQLAFDLSHLPEPMVMPGGGTAAIQASAPHSIRRDPDIFGILDDEYAMPLTSHLDLLSSGANFEALSLDENLFRNFDIPPPDMDFYLSNDRPNFNYMS